MLRALWICEAARRVLYAFLRNLYVVLRIFDASLQFAKARAIFDIEINYVELKCRGWDLNRQVGTGLAGSRLPPGFQRQSCK